MAHHSKILEPVAVLGKNIGGGGGPSSFGRQQWLSKITIEPIKNLGEPGQDLGACARWPQLRTATAWNCPCRMARVNAGVKNVQLL